MKDILGKDLNVGDTVIIIVPNYRELAKGIIIRFTKQYVFVQYETRMYKGQILEIKQRPDQLVKIIEYDENVELLLKTYGTPMVMLTSGDNKLTTKN